MGGMSSVFWLGPRPPAAFLTRLAAAGLRLSGDPEAAARVISTGDARRIPTPPPGPPWIWVSAAPLSLSVAAEAVRRGAYEAVSLAETGAADRLAARLGEVLAAPEPPPPATPEVVAESAAARQVLVQVWQAARTAMPVLITGETGTGKEVTAALVHAWSARPGPYVPINCAAIPNELMESELFGHIRGAFSGATATVDGKLLAARNGTVFLDEIDDTPLSIQTKLLRVLEDGAVTRVGETTARQADFRIVAATNRDLVKLIAQGRFGDDLYQRLAIVRVQLPPLRDRAQDIPALARHFVRRFYQREPPDRPRVQEISERALAALARHSWPGNIRELRNVIYQALVYKRAGRELLLADLRPLLEAHAQPTERALVDAAAVAARVGQGNFNLRREIESLEREALRAALTQSGGRAQAAARWLGEVGRGRSTDPGGTVRAMMKRLRVKRGDPNG
jgi:DNA-binding NtrC family response regulator